MAYTYVQGQWGSTDIPDKVDIKHYGFIKPVDLTCRFGDMQYYSRSGDSKEKFPFAFYVKLYMGSMYGTGYYSVWIPDLPSMVQLLKEIDAHKEPDDESPVADLVFFLKEETCFQEFLDLAYKQLKKQKEQET